MDSSSFVQQSKHGIIIDDDEEEESLGSFSSPSQDSSRSSSPSSSSDDFTEDTASSGPPSSSSSPSNEPLFEMSDLKNQLPFKRGLSKFYLGKSQSFTSFAEIRCVEDLAKPERRRPLKRLKASKSCGEGLEDSKRSYLPLKCCINGRTIAKRSSKTCLSPSINATRRNCLLGTKQLPPLHPHKPSNMNDHHQTLWFA